MLYYKGIKAYRVAELDRWILFGDKLSKAGFEAVHRKGSLGSIISLIDAWIDGGLI